VGQFGFHKLVEKFIPVVLSDTLRPRSGNKVESKDPEDLSLAMP